jgi:putative endonuclease
MTNHCEIGRIGEDIALQFLMDRGYSILERNFRFHHQEIDLIVEGYGMIVFVEVKTRTSERAGAGIEHITPGKQKRIINVANFYLAKMKCKDVTVRFDALSILLDKGSLMPRKVLYVQSAF